jgi:hypothetical protein
MLLRDGRFVGVASGPLDELQPGYTRTATLLTDGPMPAYDDAIFAIDTVQ